MTRRDADNRGRGARSSTPRHGLTTAGWAAKGRLDAWHRVGAVVLGVVLWAFGILGLVNRLPMFSTDGGPVLGLSSNGLLSVISLVVGAVLIGAAVRGGRAASTVTVVVGAAFLLSGLANVLVLDTPLNVLAFGMPNVIFSLLAGAVLLFLGAYGRFTGGLPLSNPYRQERHDRDDELERVPLPTPDTTSRLPRSPAWPRPTRCDGPRTGSRNGALLPTAENSHRHRASMSRGPRPLHGTGRSRHRRGVS